MDIWSYSFPFRTSVHISSILCRFSLHTPTQRETRMIYLIDFIISLINKSLRMTRHIYDSHPSFIITRYNLDHFLDTTPKTFFASLYICEEIRLYLMPSCSRYMYLYLYFSCHNRFKVFREFFN